MATATATVTATAGEYTYSTEVEYVMQGAHARITDACADRIWSALKQDRDAYLLPIRVADFYLLIEEDLQRQVNAANKLHGEVVVREWRIWVHETYDALEGEGGKWEGKSFYQTITYTAPAGRETPGAFAYEVEIGGKVFINYDGKSWEDFASHIFYQNHMLPEFDFRDTVVVYPPKA